MPKTRAGQATPHDRYWQKRIHSPAFKRALTALLRHEITALSGARVADVLDAKLVRKIVQNWDARMLNRDLAADLIIQGNRRVSGRLKRERQSVVGLLDPQLVADLEAILKEEVKLSSQAEDFVAKLMQQEFVRRLFTDIIFTAIVSFYQKVNPFFGALTMRVLEEQIKGFIRLFMPMLQQQAAAFAVSHENQRILLDFVRAIVRQLLHQPLQNYAAMVSPGQREKTEALVRRAVGNTKLDALIRRAALTAWEDLYETIQQQKVGDLLRLKEHAGWLADRGVEMILPALARPGMLQFFATELALAERQRP